MVSQHSVCVKHPPFECLMCAFVWGYWSVCRSSQLQSLSFHKRFSLCALEALFCSSLCCQRDTLSGHYTWEASTYPASYLDTVTTKCIMTMTERTLIKGKSSIRCWGVEVPGVKYWVFDLQGGIPGLLPSLKAIASEYQRTPTCPLTEPDHLPKQ